MPDLPFPLTRKHVLLALAGLAILLFVGSKLLARPQAEAGLAPPAAPPTDTSAGPTGQGVVDVVGAGRRPGLFRLGQGARVADALFRAGGATAKAELALVNLAAPLADGEQVVVPARGAAGPAVAPGGGSASGPVHLSSATVEELDSLPGIGPVTAQKILDYRQKHGAFTSVDALDAVPGIGPARLEQLKDLVAP